MGRLVSHEKWFMIKTIAALGRNRYMQFPLLYMKNQGESTEWDKLTVTDACAMMPSHFSSLDFLKRGRCLEWSSRTNEQQWLAN